MLEFLLVVVAMLVLLRFRLEMVARLEGGSRELVGIGQLFSCIWSSVSVMGLVVVSVLEVDRMGVVWWAGRWSWSILSPLVIFLLKLVSFLFFLFKSFVCSE